MITLLASDHWTVSLDPLRVVHAERGRGAVVGRGPAGALRRAEPGPCGPVVLEAQPVADALELRVWGPPATPAATVERARDDAVGWVGLRDDPPALRAVAADHPVVGPLLVAGDPPRLSRMPRVAEALGRSVLEQLVQKLEARRTIAQVAVLAGIPAPHRLWAWPTPQRIGAVPAWTLRRCGISLRSARALHAGAVDDAGLERARGLADAGGGFEALDLRLRSLPGVGAWTSAEARLRLGDPDAVSVGDYHLPNVVGDALGGDQRRAWTDADMLELLAPFAGQRGRVIRLLESAAARGLVGRRTRHAPRAALSAHRYW